MIAALFLSALALANPGKVSAFAPTSYEALCIDDAAHRNGIPLALAESLAWYESGRNRFALRRNSNATIDRGYYQVNGPTWRWLVVRYRMPHANPWDVCDNADVALRYLGDIYSITGDWSFSLAIYNAGIYNVAVTGIIPRTTRAYARAVTIRARMVEQ